MVHRLSNEVTSSIVSLNIVFIILLILSAGCKSEHPKEINPTGELELISTDYVEPGIKWGFVDLKGDIKISEQIDDCRDFSEGLAAASKAGLWGFIDTKGEWKIKPVYRGAWSFKEGKARVKQIDGKYGYIDKEGDQKIQAIYDEADDFNEGYAIIKINGRCQFIDHNGNLLTEDSWEKAFPFINGYARIANGGWWGILNRSGSIIINSLYESIGTVNFNRIAFETKGHWGYLDTTGKIIIPPKYELATAFQNQVAAAKNGAEWQWLDTMGNVLNHHQVDYVYELGLERWAAVRADTAFALVGHDGKLLSPYHYTQLNRFHDGLAVFGKDGHFGYMDSTGAHTISNIFLLAWDFKNQYARYSLGRGIGFINTQGKAVHDIFYPDVRDYHDGLAKVQTVSR